MNSFQRNIYRTEESVSIPPTLESGSISSTSQVDFPGGCDLILDTPCWIDTLTNGVVTSGDTVYSDAGGINPILGGNQYYKISLVSSYIVLIDNLGVISVSSICA